MKKHLTLLLLLLACCLPNKHWAQAPYQNIKPKLNAFIKQYNDKDSNCKLLQQWLTQFEDAQKPTMVSMLQPKLGVCIYLNKGNDALTLFPARWSVNGQKVSIEALRNESSKQPSSEMQNYVKTYLNDFENIKNDRIFKALILYKVYPDGKISDGKGEYYVSEPYNEHIVRTTSDWTYVVNYGNTGYIVFAFKNTHPPLVTDSLKARLEAERNAFVKDKIKTFPFIHNRDDYSFRSRLEYLRSDVESIKSDANFLKQTAIYKEKMKRDSLAKFVPMFNFLLQYKFPEAYLEQEDKDVDVYELKHFAAHTLADYYNGQKDYENALKWYQLAVLKYPELGDATTNHTEEILTQIAQVYTNQNEIESAYAFEVARVLMEHFMDREFPKLEAYFDKLNISKPLLRDDLVKAFETIKELKPDFYTMTFRGKEVFFYCPPDPHISEVRTVQYRVNNSELMRFLNKK